MAFEDVTREAAPDIKVQSIHKNGSADDMVALGDQAGFRPVTRRVKHGPIPREARIAFGVALGVLCFLMLVAVLRSHV